MRRWSADLANILGNRNVFYFFSRLFQTEVSPFDLTHICFSSLFQGADPSLVDFSMETVHPSWLSLSSISEHFSGSVRCICRESNGALTQDSFTYCCRVYCSPLQSLNPLLNESVGPLVKLFRNVWLTLAKIRSGRLWIHHYAEQEKIIKPQFISLPQFPNHSGISLGWGSGSPRWSGICLRSSWLISWTVESFQPSMSLLTLAGPIVNWALSFFAVKACHDFLSPAQDFLCLVPSFWCGPVSLFPYSPFHQDFGCVVLFGNFSFFKLEPPRPG